MSLEVQKIASFIRNWLTNQLQQEVGQDAEFAGLGLDSLDVVRLTDELAEHIGVDELPVALVLEHPTVSSLASHLATLPGAR